MRKQIWMAALAAAAASAPSGGAAAQGTLPISIEGRIDAGIPLGDAGDVNETGVGFEVLGVFHLTPSFGIYGGYTTAEFGVEGTDLDTELDGGELGGRITLGTGGGVWTPFAQVGALFIDDETGFEAGLGAFYPVGQNLSVTPMARYRSIDDFEYVSLGIGLNVRL
jgi:hypothetical protein